MWLFGGFMRLQIGCWMLMLETQKLVMEPPPPTCVHKEDGSHWPFRSFHLSFPLDDACPCMI
jgi:hypothetical protein